jgi:NADPH-dependent 2,4-dienoyl-CoA reductase/sulfur reductase-like enzyme
MDKRDRRFFVVGRKEKKPARKPKSSPASVVIVGAGAAGNAAAEMLRREGYDGPITLIGADEFLPYDRPNLSKDYLAGTAPEEWIPLRSADFYREQKIDVMTKTSVVAIDPNTKQVTLSDGRSLASGALLLATGAEPVRLEITGGDLPHAVVGKGSLPLEKILGRELGNLIRETHEEQGVKFHLGRTPAMIQDRQVQLDDGTMLDCDLVVVGIGVRPNTSLAETAGIATDDGVLVNEFLETNIPGIFAAGDIARWPDPRAGRIRVEHWVVAERQGQTAARNILGAREPFVAPPFFWSNHFDVAIRYVGHGSRDDRAVVSGDLKAKNASVIFRARDKLTAIASVGRDLENLKAEVALERGEEFGAL